MYRFASIATFLLVLAGCSADAGANAASESTNAEAEDVPPPDLAIAKVVLTQGVDVPLRVREKAPPAAPTVPIVAERPALVRVFVEPSADFEPTKVVARLTVTGIAKPIEVKAKIRRPSSDADLTSTLNFEIPAGALAEDADYTVELRAERAKSWSKANTVRYPEKGKGDIEVKHVGAATVRVVPITYRGIAPRLDATTLERMNRTFMKMLPVSRVTIDVRPALAFSGSAAMQTGADGVVTGGIYRALDLVGAQHERDAAPVNVLYLGVIAPGRTYEDLDEPFSGFIAGLGREGLLEGTAGECVVTGLLPGLTGSDAEFDTEVTLVNAVHELGHTMGLDHAPCGGPDFVDPTYPYAEGKTGAWGYDLFDKRLHDPTSSTDVMGYCGDVWISDYNYSKIASFMLGANGAAGTSQDAPPRLASHRRLFRD